GAACNWRIGLPAVLLLSVLSGAVELARGESVTNATGQFLNELLVGLTAVAGQPLIRANRQLSQAREQIAPLAGGEERPRLAPELHDTLGTSLSVIALNSKS